MTPVPGITVRVVVAVLLLHSRCAASLPLETQLVLQLDSSTLIPGRLARWTDLSAAGNDAEAPAALTQQPIVLANVPQLSGRAAVYFDGDSDQLSMDDLQTGNEVSVCMLMQLAPQRRSAEATSHVVFAKRGDVGGIALRLVDNAQPQASLVLTSRQQGVASLQADYAPTGDYHAMCFVRSVSQIAMHRRSRSDSAATVTSKKHQQDTLPTKDEDDPGYVLGWNGRGQDHYFRGGIAELLVWNASLSDTEASDVLDLLHSKYLVRGDLEQRVAELEKDMASMRCGHEYGGDACAPAADVDTVTEISRRVDALASMEMIDELHEGKWCRIRNGLLRCVDELPVDASTSGTCFSDGSKITCRKPRVILASGFSADTTKILDTDYDVILVAGADGPDYFALDNGKFVGQRLTLVGYGKPVSLRAGNNVQLRNEEETAGFSDWSPHISVMELIWAYDWGRPNQYRWYELSRN